jgi:hypothetical protein
MDSYVYASPQSCLEIKRPTICELRVTFELLPASIFLMVMATPAALYVTQQGVL